MKQGTEESITLDNEDASITAGGTEPPVASKESSSSSPKESATPPQGDEAASEGNVLVCREPAGTTSMTGTCMACCGTT